MKEDIILKIEKEIQDFVISFLWEENSKENQLKMRDGVDKIVRKYEDNLTNLQRNHYRNSTLVFDCYSEEND